LRKEHEQLQSSQMNRWFATGALVLLCGLLLGVMVGRQQKTRKSSFYS
jgi:SH3 domain protein